VTDQELLRRLHIVLDQLDEAFKALHHQGDVAAGVEQVMQATTGTFSIIQQLEAAGRARG